MQIDVSLIIAIIAIIFTAINTYMQFFHKKGELILSVIDSTIKNDQLKVSLIYSNNGNCTTTVTDVSISLNRDRSFSIYPPISNQHQAFSLMEREQKCITVLYSLPDFSKSNLDNIPILVHTNYINKKGTLCLDEYTIGHFFFYKNESTKHNANMSISNKFHKLAGDELVATM